MSQVKDYLASLFSLEGKTALLTGAAGGIGEALGRALAGAGATVALCDLDLPGCERIRGELEEAGLSAAAYRLDVTRRESVRACVAAALERHGKIDVLVNCAGINKREGFLDVEEATYDRIMDVNLKGVFQLTQEVAKHMVARGKGGAIINIGSHNDEMMLGGCSVYGAAKSAVRALTRSMAVEWAKHGIRANAVSPGHFLTPLTTVTWEHPTRGDYLRDRIAMRRPGTPEELAGICVMLASDSASYITGQAYHVDGGCLCGGDPWDFDTKY
jgi:NAD(P)-dependent dehydrogenase (short-subunit alcohol dehydrogenase family)